MLTAEMKRWIRTEAPKLQANAAEHALAEPPNPRSRLARSFFRARQFGGAGTPAGLKLGLTLNL